LGAKLVFFFYFAKKSAIGVFDSPFRVSYLQRKAKKPASQTYDLRQNHIRATLQEQLPTDVSVRLLPAGGSGGCP
jgi:hypothetical protein